jgi:hypothetical protein
MSEEIPDLVVKREKDTLNFKCVEIHETFVCTDKEMHLTYDYDAYMLLYGVRRWRVEELDREFGHAITRFVLDNGERSAMIRFLSKKEDGWYDQHSTINEKALEKIKFE